MILDRKDAIAANQDPFGSVWGIRPQNKELSFWIVCKRDAKGELVIPAVYPTPIFEGKWTRSTEAAAAISVYLNEAWDMAEAQQLKNERKDKNEKIQDKRLKIEESVQVA